MSHAATRRSSLAGNEADDGLFHLLADEACRLLLVSSPNLADHDDRLRRRILLESVEAIDEVRAVDRIAANSDTCRLTDLGASHLVHDFVGERARAANEPDWSR